MSDVKEADKLRGGGRRQLWSIDRKRQIIAESFEPGASVAEVARRHGVNANLLFTWRRQQGAAKLADSRESAAARAGDDYGGARIERSCRHIGLRWTDGDRPWRRGTDHRRRRC